MKKEIVVIVAGKTGVGKTTVMQIIEDALKSKGIAFRSVDDERPSRETFEARNKAVAEKVEVLIRTIRVSRDLSLTEIPKTS